MPDFQFQYRREQRVDFEVTAKDADSANQLGAKMVESFDLDSPDDASDDRGELELIENEEPDDDRDLDVCPNCGSRNTFHGQGFSECYDCGKPYNQVREDTAAARSQLYRMM